jgi:hypothetical protein
MGQKIQSSVILVCLKAQTISDGTFNISCQVSRTERISRLRTLKHMKGSPKHVSSAVFTGKAKTVYCIAINLMLKYSDMFLEGCRMANATP